MPYRFNIGSYILLERIFNDEKNGLKKIFFSTNQRAGIIFIEKKWIFGGYYLRDPFHVKEREKRVYMGQTVFKKVHVQVVKLHYSYIDQSENGICIRN